MDWPLFAASIFIRWCPHTRVNFNRANAHISRTQAKLKQTQNILSGNVDETEWVTVAHFGRIASDCCHRGRIRRRISTSANVLVEACGRCWDDTIFSWAYRLRQRHKHHIARLRLQSRSRQASEWIFVQKHKYAMLKAEERTETCDCTMIRWDMKRTRSPSIFTVQ